MSGAAPAIQTDARVLRPSIAIGPGVAATTKVIELTRGLYAITLRHAAAEADGEWPLTSIGAPRRGLQFLSACAEAGWVGAAGGTVALQIEPESLPVFITTYRPEADAVRPIEIQLTRLDGDRNSEPSPSVPEPVAEVDDVIPVELRVHLDGVGLKIAGPNEWAGETGRSSIEAFSVTALDELTADDIEYRGFGPNGLQTPWVTGGRLCGSRGRGVLLTGFAVRLGGEWPDLLDVLYEGSFGGNIMRTAQNGESCMAADDLPIERLSVRIVRRVRS